MFPPIQLLLFLYDLLHWHSGSYYQVFIKSESYFVERLFLAWGIDDRLYQPNDDIGIDSASFDSLQCKLVNVDNSTITICHQLAHYSQSNNLKRLHKRSLGSKDCSYFLLAVTELDKLRWLFFHIVTFLGVMGLVGGGLLKYYEDNRRSSIWYSMVAVTHPPKIPLSFSQTMFRLIKQNIPLIAFEFLLIGLIVCLFSYQQFAKQRAQFDKQYKLKRSNSLK